MKALINHQLFLLALFFLYSCSSASLNVDYHVPMIRSFSPESLGTKGKFGALASFHSNHQVSVMRSTQSASVFSSTPSAVVIDQVTESTVSSGFGIQGAYALIDSLDLFLAKNNEAPFELGAQFQFLGEKGMKGKGFKASFWSSFGFQEDKEDESTTSFGDNSSKLDNVEATTNIKSRSVGFLLGHRFSPSFLILVHLMHQFYDSKSDLRVNGGQAVSKSLEAEQQAATLGLRFNQPEEAALFVQLDGGISRLRLSNGPKDGHRSVSLTVGGNF